MAMETLFWSLVGLMIGIAGGWIAALYTVADECRRNGRFFVGNTVYKCTEIKEFPQGPDLISRKRRRL